MSEFKATPGPWRKLDRYVVATVDGREILIAIPDSMYLPDSQVFANAHLIAESPSLLACLEEILSAWESIPESDQVNEEMNDDRMWSEASAAIARAKGDTT